LFIKAIKSHLGFELIAQKRSKNLLEVFWEIDYLGVKFVSNGSISAAFMAEL
jgi:hypothetical protein